MLTNDISSCPYLFRDFEVGQLNRKNFYNLIICNEAIPVNNYFCENLQIDRSDSAIWTTALDCTNEVKLIQLQWRILHNIFGTGALSFKMKKKSQETCDFCDKKDTLIHFFYDCHVAKKIWIEAETVIYNLLDVRIHLTNKIVMTGLFTEDHSLCNNQIHTINHICLIGKHAISKFKQGKNGVAKIIFERELQNRRINLL